jgi:hypothetical protein
MTFVLDGTPSSGGPRSLRSRGSRGSRGARGLPLASMPSSSFEKVNVLFGAWEGERYWNGTFVA